jgi:hypothetical protein
MGGIRFLSLNNDELVKLPKFFTDKETIALLKFAATGKNEDCFPGTLCSLRQDRNFRLPIPKKVPLDAEGVYDETAFVLIPDDWCKQAVIENKMYVTSSPLQNIIYVKPRVDIFITRICILGRVCVASSIVFKKELGGYVNKDQNSVYNFDMSLNVGDNCKVIYKEDDVKYLDSVRFLVNEPPCLPKNKLTKIVLTLNVTAESSYRHISAKDINSHLKKLMGRSVFQDIYFDRKSEEKTIVLEKFDFIVKH